MAGRRVVIVKQESFPLPSPNVVKGGVELAPSTIFNSLLPSRFRFMTAGPAQLPLSRMFMADVNYLVMVWRNPEATLHVLTPRNYTKCVCSVNLLTHMYILVTVVGVCVYCSTYVCQEFLAQ